MANNGRGENLWGVWGPRQPVNVGQGPLPNNPNVGVLRYGQPRTQQPGYLNAAVAQQHRDRVAAGPPPKALLNPDAACFVEALAQEICTCLLEGLSNIQLAARRPSHIDVPFHGVCFDKHRGTGAAATSDPPLVLPSVGAGGAFTDVVNFICPTGHLGIINGWGVLTNPGPSDGNVEWQIVKGVPGDRVPGFDSFYGAQVAAAGGNWFGPPFTLLTLGPLCIHMKAGEIFTLQARNTLPAGPPAPINVAARMIGWIYQPTILTQDGTVRGTLTDQR